MSRLSVPATREASLKQLPDVAHAGLEEPSSFHAVLQLVAEAHTRELLKMRASMEDEVHQLRARLSSVAAVSEDDSHGSRVATMAAISEAPVHLQSESLTISGPSEGSIIHSRKSVVTPLDYVQGVAAAAASVSPTTSVATKSTTSNMRTCAKCLVRWRGFDFLIGLIILLNSICIGIEVDLSLSGRPSTALSIISSVEYVFLAIYVMELLLRFFVDGPGILADNWIKFDVAIVAVSVVSVIVSILVATASLWSDSVIHDALSKAMILRILRLCRLVRAVRMMGKWKNLWRLVSGALNSIQTLSSTCVLLLFVIYVYGCIAAEIISKNSALLADDRTHELVTEHFSSLPLILLTLTRFVTADGIAAIYAPCVTVQPSLVLFFGAVSTSISILLTNLITAVLVDDAISNSQMDEKLFREQTRNRLKELIPEMKHAFKILDRNSNGSVSKEEFRKADFAALQGLKDVMPLLRPELIDELFEVLDVDGNGSITEDELVNGLLQLTLSETSLDLAQLRQMMKRARRTMRHIQLAVDQTNEVMSSGMCQIRPASTLQSDSGGLPVSSWRRQLQDI